MAKHYGAVNFRGTIGGLTYTRSEDGYQVRQKSSLDKARVLNDPSFEGSRKASNEFGNAARAGKLLRTAVLGTLKNVGDSKLQSRMLKKMSEILKTDPIGGKGERLPANGNLNLLQGFEFNRKGELASMFAVQYKIIIDRHMGEAKIEFSDFSPKDDLLTPQGATHFKFVFGITEPDFLAGTSVTAHGESDMLERNIDILQNFGLWQNFTPQSELPVVIVLGLRFYQMVNKKYYQLNADGFNAVRIVGVDVVGKTGDDEN